MTAKTRILLVDDDPNLRQTLSDILRARGYAAVGAVKGKTALAKVKKEKPVVALIDLRLPDMDGLELVREIKRRSPSTECIVITGHASQASAIEAVNLGAYSYIQKPYDIEQLLVTIRRAAEKQEAEEALKQHAAQLALLNDIGGKIAAVLDLDSVLDRATRLVQESFGYHHVGLFSVDHERGELVMRARAGAFTDLFPLDHRLELGQGVVGWVGRHGQTLLANDVDAEPRYVNLYPDVVPTRSELSVPIRIGQEVVGVLDAQSPQLDAFDENDVMVMETLADQIAVAIANARLHQEAQRRVEELTFLNRVSRTVNSSLDLEQILTTVMEETALVLGTEAGSILLLDEESNELVFEAAAGLHAEEVKGLRLSLGQGVAGWVAQEGQPLLVPDVREDPRFHSDIDEATGFVTRSALAVPLRVKGKVSGVIEAVNKTEGHFDQADIELLSSMAQSAAIAIENAWLFQDSQRHAEEMAALREVNLAILSTLERDQVFAIMLDQLGTVIDYDTVAVQIITPDGRQKMIAGRGPIIHDQAMWDGFDVKDNKLVQEMRETRRPVVIHDSHTDERYERVGNWEAFHSWAGAPLFVRGDLIGFLAVEKTSPGFYDENAIQLLDDFARAAAIALEKARLYDDVRQERDYSQTLIATANALIVGLDLEGRITLFNDFCTEITGYSREEVLGQDWFTTLLPERERPPVTQVFRELVEQGLPNQYENPILTKDGRERVIAWNNTVIHDAEGRPASVLAIGQDVTERRRAEAALKEERALLARRVAERTADLSAANAELARASRLKDEFLASMSHELRTPLNAIMGLSEALQEQVYGPLNEKQLKSLRTIEESGNHLLALINDILDVSKIEAGKLELDIGPVSVKSVCQASLGLVKRDAHKRQLQVSSTFDSAVTMIEADGRRLKQILANLLSNACKFTPEGGAIGLEVVGDAEREAVHFTVWDTGIGISPEEMGRLFQPFVQLDSSLSRRYSGTGLGLALVHRLTELHGGGVSVKSEPGKGSRFTVSLPWREPVLSRAEGPVLSPPAGPVAEPEPAEMGTPLARPADQTPEAERPLILLAEDNESNMNMILDYLLAKGYRMVVARDGAEAIARAREESPDVIVMDIQMPGLDGLEATRRLQADANLSPIPIIALTALAMPGDRERCLEAGANEYFSKPVDLKRLLEAIEAQLRSRSPKVSCS